MEKIKDFIREYENMILSKTKIRRKPIIQYIISIAGFALLCLITYLIGLQFDWLYQINYLLVMTNVVVFLSYVFYKNLTCSFYKKISKDQHSVWFTNAIHYLYALTIMTTASAFLGFTAYFRAINIIVPIVLVLIAIAGSVLYYIIAINKEKILLPDKFNPAINGLLVGVLFYSVSLMIQVNNIFLSFAFALPAMLVLIIIKRFIEKKFIINISRFAVLGLGIFLIFLSFPFNRAFNYMSVWRGEFTLRVVYETIDVPIKELPKEIQGESLFYNDQFIVYNEETIYFYDNDLNLVKQLDNSFTMIYEMNGRLLANLETPSQTSVVTVFEYDQTTFVELGQYLADTSDSVVYIDSLNNQYYKTEAGYVYSNTNTNPEIIPINNNRRINPIEENDSFIVFAYPTAILASSSTFLDNVQGYTYKSIAYHDGKMLYEYEGVFLTQNPTKVDKTDRAKRLIYIADQTEYFEEDAALQDSFELPVLLRLDNFYYYNDNYYIIGHVDFSSGDIINKYYVYNEQGDLLRHGIYEGDTFTINDDYIVLNDGNFKFYELDAPNRVIYHLVEGYGVLFFVATVVALFAIKEIHLNPRRDLKFKKIIKEQKAE